MGSDDLHKKRKAKNLKDLQRKQAKRESYDRVLIVCEGEKTEPFYFIGLRDWYRLNTANIEITGECGSDPMSVFNKTKELYEKSKKESNTFDRVYCVFDKDDHPNYQQATNAISQIRYKDTFFAITSVPCFEYWLLLHFVYSTKPYQGTEDKSVGSHVLNELRKYIPDYTKGKKDIFSLLQHQLKTAIANAKRSNKEAESNYTDNPSTKVVHLVEYLINLKICK